MSNYINNDPERLAELTDTALSALKALENVLLHIKDSIEVRTLDEASLPSMEEFEKVADEVIDAARREEATGWIDNLIERATDRVIKGEISKDEFADVVASLEVRRMEVEESMPEEKELKEDPGVTAIKKLFEQLNNEYQPKNTELHPFGEPSIRIKGCISPDGKLEFFNMTKKSGFNWSEL